MHKYINNKRGFTLLELMVVIAIIGILASIAIPKYLTAVTKAREATLKEDLHNFRTVIDQYYADNGKYPMVLNDLVDRGYLRSIPKDPITMSTDTWTTVSPPAIVGQESANSDETTGIYDVHSGSTASGLNGVAYNEW